MNYWNPISSQWSETESEAKDVLYPWSVPVGPFAAGESSLWGLCGFYSIWLSPGSQGFYNFPISKLLPQGCQSAEWKCCAGDWKLFVSSCSGWELLQGQEMGLGLELPLCPGWSELIPQEPWAAHGLEFQRTATKVILSAQNSEFTG